MQSGFNTNFRHRGVLFHVQTEDSGRANPHVITHLFYGGNIIASVKREYSDHLEAENIEALVRDLMESQHKAMLKKLSRGEHDTVIFERLGAEIFSEAAAEKPPPPARPVTQPEMQIELDSPQAPPAAPAPPSASSTQPPAPLAASDSARAESPRPFGESVVSQKPLDEVVLDYLVENARKRKRTAK